MTLEERIKQLMEAKHDDAELLSEESIEDLEEKVTIEPGAGKDEDIDVKGKGNDDGDDEEDHQEPDGDEDGEDTDDDGDGEDTEMSQDTGKKDKVDVKEGTDPFGKLDPNGAEEAAGAKNAKLKAKQGAKDDAGQGKLATPPSSGAKDDNGDNARLQAGASKKETTGKLTGPSAGGGENPDVARNDAGTEIQKGASKSPVGVKEHMNALFQGEELSEDFQKKAATIFEAAVESSAQERIDALTEEYAQQVVALKEEMQVQLDEAVEEVRSELVENIDGFLNYVVEQWIDDNQVALESGMKVEMVNSFIDGLKNLFKEHYVEMPEEKLDVVQEQATEIEHLAQSSAELAEENKQLVAELVALKSALVFESVADDLTDVQREKFLELVENVEFTSDEEYTGKLETLKENYFPNGQTVEIKQEVQQVPSDTMDAYVKAVSQNLKFR